MGSRTDGPPKRAFCELCCCEYQDITLHNKGLQHRGGVTHKCDTCKKGFSSVTALRRHYGASACPSSPVERPVTRSTVFCTLCWIHYDHTEDHNKSTSHLKGATLKCPTCFQDLSGPSALQRHCSETSCVRPPRESQYQCGPCGLSFPGPKSLKKHLTDPAIHPPPLIIPENPEAFCTLCNKQCKTVFGLQSHLISAIHNPLTSRFPCVASTSCRKSFNAPSALLYHLESGSCPSGLTWQALAELIIANDPTNIITEPDAAATRAAFAGQMLLYLGIDTDSDSSTDGGVTFTPPPMSRSDSSSTEGGAKIFHTPSEGSQGTITPRHNSIGSDNSDDFAAFDFQPRWVMHPESTSSREFSTGIPTPSPSEDGSEESGVLLDLPVAVEQIEFGCPLCSETKRKFRTREALQSHMESQTHASKIYHCPLKLLLGLGKQKGKRGRKFKALSALAQHIEMGACEGKKEAFAVVAEATNEKLKEAGLREMKKPEAD